MDSSLATALITNAGIAGIVIILMIFKILVPGWYAKKLEEQNETLSATAEKAVSELTIANQLIGDLRAIALQRAGLSPELAGQLTGGGNTSGGGGPGGGGGGATGGPPVAEKA